MIQKRSSIFSFWDIREVKQGIKEAHKELRKWRFRYDTFIDYYESRPHVDTYAESSKNTTGNILLPEEDIQDKGL